MAKPATTTLNVPASAISLVDMLGREVIRIEGKSSIDVSHLPRGMYVVRLKAVDDSIVTRKIVLR